MNEVEVRITTLLSTQNALLGRITPNIRGVACKWDKYKITLRFIFDGEFTEDEREELECAATEVISNFTDRGIETQFVSVDLSESIYSYQLSEWVYMRKE